MKLQITIVLTLGILFINNQSTTAQEYQIPKITKSYPQIPDYGKPIEYRFSDEINKIIGAFIAKTDTTEKSFWGELEKSDSINELSIWDYYTYPINSIDSSSDISGKLISSTNRYCNVRNNRIPISFPSDREYGGYTFCMTGTPLVIKFKRIKQGQYKIIWVGHYD
ncbi:hypothetical protein [Lentimicrobium sp. S6]|nr:hypothetical protein [Lentimicrobium sp. S6]NPD47180.1 hypothetical protein [Lentimicrobium sp. S6]